MKKLFYLVFLLSCSTEQETNSKIDSKRDQLIRSQKRWEELNTGKYSDEIRRYLGPSLSEMNYEWTKTGFQSDRAVCRSFQSGVSMNGGETILIDQSWTETGESVGSHSPQILSFDQMYRNCIDSYNKTGRVSFTFFQNGLLSSCTNSELKYFLHEIKIDNIDCTLSG